MLTNKNPRLKIIVGTITVLVVIVFIFFKSNLDPKEIITTISLLDTKFLLLAFGMNTLQVCFWVLRAWPLLPRASSLGFLNLAKAIVLGQFLNSFVPARAGDVTKIYLLSSNKLKNPLRSSAALGLLATDKLVDLVAILLLAFFSGASKIDSASGSFSQFSFYYLIPIPILLILGWFLLTKNFKAKIKFWVSDFFLGIKVLLSPRASIPSLIFGLSVWTCEALAILFVLKAAGVSVQFSEAIYIMCIVNLGILVPVSLANVGAYEAAFVYGVSKFNMGTEAAISLAVTQHFLQSAAMAACAIAMFNIGGKIKLSLPTSPQ